MPVVLHGTWSSPAIAYLQLDCLLKQFQGLQFVQSTGACFTCQRLDQCFCDWRYTLEIVQAGDRSRGRREVLLGKCSRRKRLRGCRCDCRHFAITSFRRAIGGPGKHPALVVLLAGDNRLFLFRDNP